ncbi:MAG: hypothetical protein QOE88_697, partial [Verrucomicrobiota bacterium]|nr:hypothetical protein [Verrucomicrobiota bacterium]
RRPPAQGGNNATNFWDLVHQVSDWCTRTDQKLSLPFAHASPSRHAVKHRLMARSSGHASRGGCSPEPVHDRLAEADFGDGFNENLVNVGLVHFSQ